MIWLIVIAVVAIAVAGLPLFRGGVVPPAGSVAPDFTLPRQDGTPVHLAGLRGQWVVLYFYPRDNTPVCTLEARNFQLSLEEFAKRNAVILGVSVDSVDSHQNFCQSESLGFHLLSDRDGKVARSYGSLTNFGVVKVASRRTFLIDPQGRLVRSFLSVDAKVHNQELLAALDAARAAA